MADLPQGFVLDSSAPPVPQGFELDGPDNRNWLQRTMRPRREEFAESPVSGTPEQVLTQTRQLRDPNASLSQDRYGNPTIQTNGQTLYTNRPGPSMNDIPNALNAVDRTIKDVAPFLASGAATGGAGWIPATAAQMATGLATESIDQTGNAIQGRPVDGARLVTTPLFAGAGEAGGRLAFAALRPVFTKLFGSSAPSSIVNADGSLTDDALKALEGVPSQQLDDLAKQELSKMQQAGVLSKEQAERFNFFKSQGIEPTRAQVTRTADDFMMQQEAAKTSTRVRGALEGQEGQISQAFDTAIRGTGGAAQSSGSPIADAVLNKASALDTEISNLYNQARQAASGEKTIGLNQLAQNLRVRATDNELTGGLISSLRGDLMERGIIDRNFKVRGKIDVETAETVRQVMNSRWNSTNDFGRQIIRQLKNSLDDDVLRTAGDDIFQQARTAKASFESGLRPESLSKFDTNERSLVRNILENKIKADDVFDQAILSKSWKASDLRELKNYLVRGSQEQAQVGTKAWNDLRAEAVQWIKDETFSNALSQEGQATMRSGAVRRSLDKIGPERLSVLFTGEERTFLNSMARLEQLRQPVPGTGVGQGPSAQAIAGVQSEIRRAAAKLPMVGTLIDILQNQSAAIRTLSTPISGVADTAAKIAQRRGVIPYAGPAAVAVEDRLMSESP